jgi:hypothetical protein
LLAAWVLYGIDVWLLGQAAIVVASHSAATFLIVLALPALAAAPLTAIVAPILLVASWRRSRVGLWISVAGAAAPLSFVLYGILRYGMQVGIMSWAHPTPSL